MFLYPSEPLQAASAAPDWQSYKAGEEAKRQAFGDLYAASRDLGLYRDDLVAEGNALAEAYKRRNEAIFEATGIQLDNPTQLEAGDVIVADPLAPNRDSRPVLERKEAEWLSRVGEIARERPDAAAALAVERPIREDAFAIVREAEANSAAADQRAEAAGLGTGAKLTGALGGGIAAMVRDPVQIASLFVGAGISSPARAVGWRMLQTMLTEAALNGGVEAALQAASQDWKRRAGVDASLSTALKQVGLAAAFGGGFGGLVQSAHEVFRLLGKPAPAAALNRVAAGSVAADDVATVAKALDVEPAPETLRVAELATEQAELDRAATPLLPEGLGDDEAERLAAAAMREAEAPSDVVPTRDLQERRETIERLTKQTAPLGKAPRKPTSLLRFLAAKGIRDEGGELAAMDLGKHFVPGQGKLVRAKGVPLDRAREAAAEAGYLDDLYPAGEAVERSTPDDLLRLIRQELGGEPVYSRQEDGDRLIAQADYERRQELQQQWRNIFERVDTAISELGIDHRLDDSILKRAAELTDDDEDGARRALEQALEEDYRRADEQGFDDAGDNDAAIDFPDWDLPADAGRGSRPGGEAGSGSAGRPAEGGGTQAADREELPGAGAPERQAGIAGGRAVEPGTPQAAAIADLTLTEAGGRAEAASDDPWAAFPAGTDAEGRPLHATYDEMIEDAERSDFLGDVIKSCKD